MHNDFPLKRHQIRRRVHQLFHLFTCMHMQHQIKRLDEFFVKIGYHHQGGQSIGLIGTFIEQKELGIDAEFYIWAGLYAPAGTPEPVVRRLREAVREAVQDPQFRAGMEAAGQPLDYRDAPEFRSFWETDAKKMAEIVRRIGRLEDKK